MKMKRHQQKLILLGVVLFFMWNLPFVTVFDADFQLFGFPAFYLFIFLGWLLAIVIAYLLLKKHYE